MKRPTNGIYQIQHKYIDHIEQQNSELLEALKKIERDAKDDYINAKNDKIAQINARHFEVLARQAITNAEK